MMNEARLTTVKLRSVLLIFLSVLTALSNSSKNPNLFDTEGSAYGVDGSGEEYGSGSGEYAPPEPSPVTNNCAPSNASFTLVSEADTVLEGRCRSLCVEKILQNESLSVQSFVGDDFYMSVSTESLRKNCHIYQQVFECTVGCQMGMDRSGCASNCYDRCMESSDPYLPDSSCAHDCDRQLCSIGCGAYSELKMLPPSGLIPMSPVSPFSILPFSYSALHAAATYKITFTSDSQDRTSLNQSTVSFVVQVSDGEHITHYWLPSLDTPLQIGSFLVCKTVKICVLPVNKYGPAGNYSSSLSVETYGDIWPPLPDHPQPYLVTFSQKDDTRADYWEHAIISISWQPPNRVQHLTSYTVKITSPDQFLCGESKNMFGLNHPHYTWEAESPADGPINNCTYQILVLSEPHNATYPGPQKSVAFEVKNLGNAVPNNSISLMEIKCLMEDSMGNIVYFKPSISWSLPLNPVLTKGIKHFELNLSAWKMNNELVKLDSLKSVVIEFETVQNSKTQIVGFNTSYELLIQELNIVYRPGYAQYLGSTHSCQHRLQSPPPVTVIAPNYIILDENEGLLYLDISWAEPEFPQGKILHYDVYLGQEVLVNDTQPSSSIALYSLSTTTIAKKIPLSEEDMKNGVILNLQVQATSSIGLQSVWSAPYQFDPHTSDFLLDLSVSCNRRVTIDATLHQTFHLTIEWVVPHQIMGLEKFTVTLMKIRQNGSEEHVEKSEKLFENSKTVYFTEFEEYIYTQSVTSPYTIELKPFYEKGYPERTHGIESCVIDGSRVPPSEIKSVSMPIFKINEFGELNISLTWEEPEETAGGILNYLVYIGVSPLSGSDPDPPPRDRLILREDVDPHFVAEMNSDLAKALASLNTSVWTFYIQILTKSNTGSFGNWTEPLYREIKPFVFLVRPTSTPVPTSTSVNPGKTPTKAKNNGIGPLVPVMSAVIPIMFVLIIAIILVSVLLLIAFCQNRNIRNKSEMAMKSSAMFGIGNLGDNGDKWEVSPVDVEKLSLVGEGTFGEVHSGQLQRMPKGRKDESIVPVFINSFRAVGSDDQLFKFTKHLEKHKIVSSVDHPFFLSLVGCSTTSQPFYLITELADNGDLLTFLQNHRTMLQHKVRWGDSSGYGTSSHSSHLTPSTLQHTSRQIIRPADLINFARQIASAMDCLAGLGIVHSDLAARNVYIDHSYTLKVADFGVVSDGKRDVVYVNGVPLRWLSPEVLVDHTYSTAADIWAFGVTVWEIITLGEFPYQDISDKELLRFLNKGGRLSKPSNCSSELFAILQVCWENDPKRRPSFELLHETLLNRLTRDETSSLLSVHPNHFLRSVTDDVEFERKSPTSDNSSDSAISEDRDVGVTVEIKHGKVPDLKEDARKTIPTGQNPTKCCSRGFRNPAFRRTSLKAVDLDSPMLQVSHDVTPTNTATTVDISESDLPIKLDTSACVPTPSVMLEGNPAQDGSTEV